MPLLFTQLELAAQLQRARETQLVNGCQIFIDVHSSTSVYKRRKAQAAAGAVPGSMGAGRSGRISCV
jgi:hypothetical protein